MFRKYHFIFRGNKKKTIFFNILQNKNRFENQNYLEISFSHVYYRLITES